jgi:hypothetical protein
MGYALRVVLAFAAATAAGEVIEHFVASASASAAPGETRLAFKLLVYVPALAAALWAAATAKRVQNAFVAGLLWALVAHTVHAIALALALGAEPTAAAAAPDPGALFYWTRALVYRAALCVGVVVMLFGTLRRLGRMRGERDGGSDTATGGDSPGNSTRPWAVFQRRD